jgi:hypothetical protein
MAEDTVAPENVEQTNTAAQEEPQQDAPRQESRVFTQEEVNRIVGERVERERKKYADYDVLKNRVAELEPLLEKVSEVERRATVMEAALAENAIRADFVEKVVQMGCSNARLAFLAAQADGLLGSYDPETGEVSEHDFETLRKRYPNLFTSSASIDAGTRSSVGEFDINRWIRSRAG